MRVCINIRGSCGDVVLFLHDLLYQKPHSKYKGKKKDRIYEVKSDDTIYDTKEKDKNRNDKRIDTGQEQCRGHKHADSYK